ncbi:MAG: DUF3239 domain-containing protein [Bacteroidota bacterium]
MIHTVDSTTKASTPGQIQISKSKYLDYLALTGITRFKYYHLLSISQDTLFKFFSSNEIIFDFIQKTEQFKYGCLNPTIVIDKKEGIIATFTNLTSYGKKITPVIKISIEPLHLIKNIDVKNGQKLPTVALYTRNLENEYANAWTDFDPKIANCFTDDINACGKLLLRVSENAWKCLDEGLKQIDNNKKAGLYHINLATDLVRSAY